MVHKFFYNEDASTILAGGVNCLAGLLKDTYGPLGNRILIGNPLSVPVSVRSGNGMIQEFDLNNPGMALVREAILNMGETEGDGTTTAAILLQKLVNSALRKTGAGINPVRFREALNVEAERVCRWLEETSEKKEDIKAAAKAASAGDEELEALVSRAFESVTEDGIVTVRDTKGVDSYVEVLDSVEIDQGYLSEEMVTNPEDASAVLEYPYILLTDQVISKSEMIVPAMNLARKAGKSLFVMAQDITGEALATLVFNIRNGKLWTVAVKATAYGERRKEILEDLAAATGAVVISGDLGENPAQVTAYHFGTAASVRTTKNHTYISGGKGNPDLLRARAARIRAEIRTAAYEADRVNLKNRLARLEGGVAVIYVGAQTETEMRARRQKVKSMVAAVKAILKHGTVAGGGIALFDASRELYGGQTEIRQTGNGPSEETEAANVFKEMLAAPLMQLLANSGDSSWEIMEKLKTMPAGYGYDVIGKQYGNMVDMGIMDAVNTLCKAVRMAASLTGLIITAGAVIRDESLLKQDN